MNGIKFFLIHILVKDLSFMILYWILIKYFFTEINHPSLIAEVNFRDIFIGAFYYNIVPIMVSLILYFPIVYGIKKIKLKKKIELIFTGFLLTLTTPFLYLVFTNWKHNDYYYVKPELVAWFLCFIISIGFYYMVNSVERP